MRESWTAVPLMARDFVAMFTALHDGIRYS